MLKFNQFLSDHNKHYITQEEFQARFNIFQQNLAAIEAVDPDTDTFTLSINQFADLTAAEYQKKLGFVPGDFTDPTSSNTTVQASTSTKPVGATMPASLDWRNSGAVTPIKNQGSCGDCWAFSSTGAMEGAYQIKTGQLISFSEQQLMDCATSSYGNYGCSGGSMVGAFSYLKSYKMMTEASYPYSGYQGRCAYNAANGVVNVKSTVNVPANNPSALLSAVQVGPVSVAIDASSSVFQFYTSGVINSSSCGTSLDHGVLLIGYGTTSSGQNYWLLKNSWGTWWGNQGYFMLERDNNSGPGMCGVLQWSSYPQL